MTDPDDPVISRAIDDLVRALADRVRSPLGLESATYEKLLPHLTRLRGKFALIQSDQLHGIYETRDDALKDGYRLFNIAVFMVREIGTPTPYVIGPSIRFQ